MSKSFYSKVTVLSGIGFLMIFLLSACAELGPATLKGERNNYNIAFNSSNMSNARLDFTFPYIPDLRLEIGRASCRERV